jgi:hypothetical protein
VDCIRVVDAGARIEPAFAGDGKTVISDQLSVISFDRQNFSIF